MADKAAGIFDGGAGAEAIEINLIANEAMKIGSPVQLFDAASGEIMPRAGHPTSNLVPVVGVVTGGDNNGIWVDGTLTNDGNAAAAAGEVVKVCIFGRCKCRVDGDTAGAFVAGVSRLAYKADGVADVALVTENAFAVAGQDATGAFDAIIVFVNDTGLDRIV